MSHRYAALALLLLACDAGPVLYLGVPRAAGTDGSDGGTEDGDLADAAERDADDDEVPCVDQNDCAALRGEPHCHPRQLLCVECLTDSHCAEDEHCDADDGDCEEDR